MTEKYSDPRFAAVAENYRVIADRVANAAIRSGRNPEDVILMAATKTVPVEVINHAIDCGLRYIGENRVQEFMDKYEKIQWSAGVTGHIIGRLQTNKVKYIADKVSCIQSVDSLKLAKEISKHCERLQKRMQVLVEVNIGNEESKGGIQPESLEDFLWQISELQGIAVNGLMAIPPFCEKKSDICNYFSRMKQYFIDIGAKKIDNVSMNCLSMGMSSDYEEAILCGATMVRVGSSLFGERIYPK